MQDTLLLRRAEVAGLLNISLRQVDRLLVLKVLPTRRIGRAVRVPRHHVESFALSANQFGSQAGRENNEAAFV